MPLSTFTCPALGLMLTISSAHSCHRDVPTNRSLIAAMPDDIESVMLLDAKGLLRDGSPLRDECLGFFGIDRDMDPNFPPPDRDFLSSQGDNNLDRIVFVELAKLKPIKRLVGGASFAPPQGIGIGPLRFLSLWITAESNEPVRHRIESREGIVGDVVKTTHDRIGVYQSLIELRWTVLGSPEAAKPVTQSVFIAFPNPHVTVIALSLEHVMHVSRNLNSVKAAIPPRWADAAKAVDVEAPLVVLRKFDRPEQRVMNMESHHPDNINIVTVPIGSFALIALDTSSLQFKLRVQSGRPDDAVHYFHGGTFHGGFAPVYWKWTRANDAGGFLAEVEFIADKDTSHHCSLIIMTLFGIQIAI